MAISGLFRRNKAADEQLEIEPKEITAFIRKSDGPTQRRAISAFRKPHRGQKVGLSVNDPPTNPLGRLHEFHPLR